MLSFMWFICVHTTPSLNGRHPSIRLLGYLPTATLHKHINFYQDFLSTVHKLFVCNTTKFVIENLKNNKKKNRHVSLVVVSVVCYLNTSHDVCMSGSRTGNPSLASTLRNTGPTAGWPSFPGLPSSTLIVKTFFGFASISHPQGGTDQSPKRPELKVSSSEKLFLCGSLQLLH